MVTDILSDSEKYVIAAYIDDLNITSHITQFNNRPLLRSRKHLTDLLDEGIDHAVIAIGKIETRVKLVKILDKLGFTFIKAIHKTAIISNRSSIGINTIIKAGAIIDPHVTIGNHSYIGAGVTIGHDCNIGEFVNVTGGSKISGHVSIGNQTLIGTGTVIKDRISIGERSIIGAGSVVVFDIQSDSIAKGVPAKISNTIKG